MKKSFAMIFVVVVLVGGLVFHRIRDNSWTVTELFTKLYSEWGSTHCGHVTNSHYHGPTSNPEAAIECVQTALKNRHAFTVMFTGYGTDDEISSA
jgi:hypothetical protein